MALPTSFAAFVIAQIKHSVIGPAYDYQAVTPHNDTLQYGRSLFVGGAGDVVLESFDGNSATFACAAGTVLPCSFKKVKATGTTATLLIGLV